MAKSRQLLTLISLFILFIALFTQVSAAAPSAKEGILDLRGYDCKHRGPISLNGEWAFYWNEFVPPQSPHMDSTHNIFVSVPSVWNSYKIDGKKLPGRGFGTYRLKILLDQRDSVECALKLLGVNTSYRLFVNGKEVRTVGRVGTTAEESSPQYDPMLTFLDCGASELDLVFHVSNFTLRRGGFRERILFGERESLVEHRERNVVFELFLFGTIFIMGLQYLAIYLIRRKDLVHLSFSIICLTIAFRMMVLGERYLLHIFPKTPFELIQFLALGLALVATAAFVFYIKELFPGYFAKWIPKLILIVISIEVTIITFSSPYISSFMMIPMQITSLLALGAILVVVVKTVYHREPGSSIILGSTVLVFGAAVNDVLYDRSLSPFINLLPLALFLFFFSQTVLLSRRTATIQRNIERLSESINKTNIALKKFVPHEFLLHLKKEAITEIELGDQVLKQMSILFADIRSFTALSETMSPQENFNFINSYLDQIWPAIESNRGFVDKYVGDAVMALFSNVADDAIRAAIDMQKKVAEFNRESERKESEKITIGIGVHTGNLMLGTIGHSNRMETTVISDAVNLTARMEGLTKLYGAGIITSQDALDLCKNSSHYHIRYLDTVQVRGKRDNVVLIEVLDGLPDQQFSKKIETREEFEKATEAYRSGDLITARTLLSHVVEVNEEDRAALFYMERCDHYLKEGLPDDWSGIQVFQG